MLQVRGPRHPHGGVSVRRKRRRGRKNGAVFVPKGSALLTTHVYAKFIPLGSSPVSGSSTGAKKERHSHSRTRRGSAGDASERPSMSSTEMDF